MNFRNFVRLSTDQEKVGWAKARRSSCEKQNERHSFPTALWSLRSPWDVAAPRRPPPSWYRWDSCPNRPHDGPPRRCAILSDRTWPGSDPVHLATYSPSAMSKHKPTKHDVKINSNQKMCIVQFNSICVQQKMKVERTPSNCVAAIEKLTHINGELLHTLGRRIQYESVLSLATNIRFNVRHFCFVLTDFVFNFYLHSLACVLTSTKTL